MNTARSTADAPPHADARAARIPPPALTTPATALADLTAKVRVLLDSMTADALDREAELAAVRSVLGDLATLTEPPRPPAIETLEAYNAWLHMERRLLALEMYPTLGVKAERFVPHGNAGDAWHFRGNGHWRDLPQPSTRAATVLHALGVLPEAAQ